MTLRKFRQRRPVSAILTYLLAAAACLTLATCSSGNKPNPEGTASSVAITPEEVGTGSPPAQTSTAVATAGAATPTTEPVVTPGSSSATAEPGEIVALGNVPFGPGPFNLPATTAGLADLAGYKATLTLSFDGTEAGQPSQWTTTYVMSDSTEPAARQLTIASTSAVADPDPVTMTEIDGVIYERHGESVCTAGEIAPGESLAELLEPAGFLNAIIGAELVGSETVNGVAADHYNFDERALGLLGFAESTGEIWVASDGGYVLKYVLTTAGEMGYFGEAVEGTATWDYTLTDINQPVAIELPENCLAGLVDAPLLPDATGVVIGAGLLSYSTITSLADTVVFYQAQLPALGWQQSTEPFLDKTTALLDFTQANQQLSIIITTGDGPTAVNIALGSQLE